MIFQDTAWYLINHLLKNAVAVQYSFIPVYKIFQPFNCPLGLPLRKTLQIHWVSHESFHLPPPVHGASVHLTGSALDFKVQRPALYDSFVCSFISLDEMADLYISVMLHGTERFPWAFLKQSEVLLFRHLQWAPPHRTSCPWSHVHSQESLWAPPVVGVVCGSPQLKITGMEAGLSKWVAGHTHLPLVTAEGAKKMC